MKLEKDTARKLTRDIIISLFIYALPVVLMLLTFYVNGQRPWKEKTTATILNNH
ncbi:hypothetical protein [Flavihumibacter profundi]|jgi:hypothetical protein|uniref:hypothetical protein n=1 Tax=Flavihumibacter profundi TaxID=2716883 RepID=UPI001CC4191C|nr:hypothetical protein [Flavihumibacter profundi]MBZ5856086.1 hypothetical protein [Flavihumibacter profundi]